MIKIIPKEVTILKEEESLLQLLHNNINLNGFHANEEVVNNIELSNKDLSNIILYNIIFEDVDFTNVAFESSELENVSFINCTFTDSLFEECKIYSTAFNNCTFKNSGFVKCNMEAINAINNNCNDLVLSCCSLEYSEIRNLSIKESSFSKSLISESKINRCTIKRGKFSSTILRDAIVSNSATKDCKFSPSCFGFVQCCPEEGSFIGYKVVWDSTNKKCIIATLEIPEGASRLSSISEKCRCSYAKVLDLEYFDGSPFTEDVCTSLYFSNKAKYSRGNLVFADSFNTNILKSCANGIHFFMNKHYAKNYAKLNF